MNEFFVGDRIQVQSQGTYNNLFGTVIIQAGFLENKYLYICRLDDGTVIQTSEDSMVRISK